MSSDISYGQLVVISGVNVNNDIVSASQKAIAFATSNGMLAEKPITGLSAETFNFNKDVNIGDDLIVGGKITANSDIILNNAENTDKVLVINSDKSLSLSSVTTAELENLLNSSSNIQSQIDTKAPIDGPNFTGDSYFSTSTFEGTATFLRPVNVNNTFYVSDDTRIAANLVLDDNFTINTDKFFVKSETGEVGILTADPSCTLDISASDAIRIPVGTTDQRPSVFKTGQIRFNTTTSQFEGYNNNSSWQGLGGVVDIDQDTKILAETNPLDDNDEIQIYTDGVERMRIDASGNMQLKQSNPSFVALDISATSGIKLPKGGKNLRPVGGSGTISSDISGTIRFNTDTSLCEMYTASEIWSALPVYKAEQPPKLLNISQIPLSESVSVHWNKFQEIYKDADDGKSYPIYFQTFVDISFTNISNQDSNGWKTILIGNGNYDINDIETTPLTSINFDSVVQTIYSNTTGYNLNFQGKPSTINLPVFTQDDSFDLRVYGVNNSGTLPNYIYINNVQLKQTGAPGPVEILNTTDIDKSSLIMDLSFNLDSNDTAITSGISITHYDISFSLSDTKSLDTRTHSGNYYIHWNQPNDLGKDNIKLPNLIPGAKYNIQIRAKNALKFNANGTTDGPSPTNLYKYGEYGAIFESTGFTNTNNNPNGLDTSRYLETSDLNSVNPTGMQFTLNNQSSINCHINGLNNRQNRTILSKLNNSSSISITGESRFFVNYGKQGNTKSVSSDVLVKAYFTIKNSANTNTLIMNFNNQEALRTITLGNGYKFDSSNTYTDESKSILTDARGFVYSVGIQNAQGNNSNTIFYNTFDASTNSYYISYLISSQGFNNNERLQISNISNTGTISTGPFYVDDYNSTPIVTFVNNPVISITTSKHLFGIPSVLAVQATAIFKISNFANHIIPYLNGRHSHVKSIVKNSYTLDNLDQISIYQNNEYQVTYDKTTTLISGRYDERTDSNYEIEIYYLDNSVTPEIAIYNNNVKNLNNLGKIFKDLENNYTDFNLHFFNAGNSTINTTAIVVDDTNFATSYSSEINSALLRFNNKFVSGGFIASYSSTSINAFSDWTNETGNYAIAGPNYQNYNNTGVSGYKWIAINVTSKKVGNRINLSNFKINGSYPNLEKFNNSGDNNGYRAYISFNNKFGSLERVSNSGETSWFNNSNNININNADSINGALQNNGIDAFIDSTTSSQIYLIVGLPQSKNTYFTFT